MLRTAVGYCGGSYPEPTYRKVCGDPVYSDYAEAVHVDFDPSVLTYDQLLDAFFNLHDAIAAGRSRQYASIIFSHDDEQASAAAAP